MALPGWYPDPVDPSAQRYWNGAEWTQQTAPGSPAVSSEASAPSPVTRRNGPARWLLGVGVLAAVGALIVTGVLVFGGSDPVVSDVEAVYTRLGGRCATKTPSREETLTALDEGVELTASVKRRAREVVAAYAPETKMPRVTCALDDGDLAASIASVIGVKDGNAVLVAIVAPGNVVADHLSDAGVEVLTDRRFGEAFTPTGEPDEQSDCRVIHVALKAYRAQHGQLPRTLDELEGEMLKPGAIDLSRWDYDPVTGDVSAPGVTC